MPSSIVIEQGLSLDVEEDVAEVRKAVLNSKDGFIEVRSGGNQAIVSVSDIKFVTLLSGGGMGFGNARAD